MIASEDTQIKNNKLVNEFLPPDLSIYECPHCDGNKTEIDDNDPNGAVTCYYCDGKGWVSYDECEAYHDHDPNLM